MPESSDAESPPQVPTGRRRDYIPSAQPGSRLPHMFVRVNPLSEVGSTVNIIHNINNKFSPNDYRLFCLPPV